MQLKYTLYTLLAVVFTFLFHEFSHWTMGELLGYEMVMTLNKCYPVKMSYIQNWHYTLISAVGPLITLLQSFIIFLLMKRTSNKNWYPFLFASFYVELLSGIMNFRNPNDLGRISKTFDLGLLTLPLIFIIIHLFLVYKTSVMEKFTVKFNLVTVLLIIVFSSVWILVNQKYKVVILSS